MNAPLRALVYEFFLENFLWEKKKVIDFFFFTTIYISCKICIKFFTNFPKIIN